MASVGASALLGADVTLNAGASTTPFMAQPFPPPTAGPAHRSPREQHSLPLTTLSFPPGRPLVLPALPRAPLVAGDAGQGPSGTGACNILDQVRPEGGRPQPSKTWTTVLTQAPLNGSAPGALCGGAVCPAPLFLEASAVETIMPLWDLGGTQASEGGWCPGLPPQAPPPAAQLAPVFPSVNAGPSRTAGRATSRSKASLDDTCNPKSVYEDFRRWQRFKALARGHLPQSPDAEALACFLIPVLRPLSRLKPTMTLEEGIGRAMQEWQRRSHFDRRIYYEMAEKFMECEAEEERQMQKLQLMKGAQTQPPPAPPRAGPQGPPAPVLGPQPALTHRKAVPSAQRALTLQPPWETESPNQIPPEAVQEYMDIMDELEGQAHSATGAPGGEWGEDRKESQQKEGLLSYLDQQCSQEDLMTKVEALIDPQLQEKLFSLETQLGLLAKVEELEQEGFSAAQQLEKRLLASKEEAVQAPPGHAHSPRKAVPSAQCALTPQPPQETESPSQIPPEAAPECSDIVDVLDEDFQRYIDRLCSHEDLIPKLEEVIGPHFLEIMNSSDAQQDPCSLAEDLEQEEGLTPAQLLEEPLLASTEEEAMQAPPGHGAPLLDSSPSESAAGQDAQRRDHGPQLGVNDKPCAPETGFKDHQRHGRADAHLPRPRAFAVSSGCQEFPGRQERPPLRAPCPASPPQGHGCAYSGLGPRDGSVPRETSLVRETLGPVDRCSEDEEDLASLAFLWASPGSLLPCRLSLSPVPASGPACPGGRGPRGPAQVQLSRAAPPASKSRKRALGGGPAHAERTPLPGADLGVCGSPALALGLVPSSQPQKRKCDHEQSAPGSWRKRHCSEDGAVGCPSRCQSPKGPRGGVAWLSPRAAKGSFSSQG